MSSNFDSIIRDLKNKIYHPVYMLHGTESYYIDLIADYIEKNVLDEEAREFNQSVYYGRDLDLGSLVSTVKRYPMMSDYQVVIIKEAQELRDLTKDTEGFENPFLQYLEKPLKSTIAILCYKHKSLDKRKRFYKILTKNAVVFESDKLKEDLIPGWVANYAVSKKYSITNKASQILADYLGNDLSKISNELDKLMLNLPEGTEIKPEHIEKFVGISKDYNSFELQDAIVTKNLLKANRIANYFAANQKNNPFVLTLTMLYSFFSKLLAFHSLTDRSPKNVSTVLGINPYFVGKFALAANNYNATHVIYVLSILKEFDLKYKGVDSNNLAEDQLLREMIYKIMH